MNNLKKFFSGMLIGIVNVTLGAGGGMLTVPLYKKCGFDQKSAQINAVATILPITVISLIIYLLNGNVNLRDTYSYVIFGLPGAILGTFVIKKTSNKLLQSAFALFMIWAGVRMITK
ncbi:MAG: sulfite exporter TauE/SafE family protein [Oscillospiraceae bacterium]|nr:sulfite exporter TauE/SafE family protein [Oscillospiraceae bacterium]